MPRTHRQQLAPPGLSARGGNRFPARENRIVFQNFFAILWL